MRGQVAPMREMLDGLRQGLMIAIGAIFLLLAANFQSLKLSIVVMSTAPAALAGVALALWLTHTTINLDSFMGAIMALGVAVANAILLVTFAERARMSGATAAEAAKEGARSRLRPILMTSLAMIAGMLPLAIGLGDADRQMVPLGRAVVGGLVAPHWQHYLCCLPSSPACKRTATAAAYRCCQKLSNRVPNESS